MPLSVLTFVIVLGCLTKVVSAQALDRSYDLRFLKPASATQLVVDFYFEDKRTPTQRYNQFGLGDRSTTAKIPLALEGVKGLSVLAYQPGCFVEYLFVEDLKNTSQVPAVPCVPQEPVRIHFVIQNALDARVAGMVAEVSYEAIESHTKDDLTTNYGVSFQLGRFPVQDDGSIDATLPNLGNDPVVNEHLKHGHLNIWLRVEGSYHNMGWLVVPHNPSQTQHFVEIAPTYPNVVKLEVSTKNQFAGY